MSATTETQVADKHVFAATIQTKPIEVPAPELRAFCMRGGRPPSRSRR